MRHVTTGAVKFLNHLVYIVLFLLCVFNLNATSESSEQVFTDLYERGAWDGISSQKWFSGGGAQIENARKYMVFLQDFLRSNNIQSVVDAGCGDWQFSQYIDWKGISYTGYDVVQYIIERNQDQFAGPGVAFVHADLLKCTFPQADLLICKDVLQHLSHDDIHLFLTQLPKFKYCLITNDVDPRTLTSKNQDIPRGGSRTLDLTKPPFNIMGQKIFLYRSGRNIKQVLLIKR